MRRTSPTRPGDGSSTSRSTPCTWWATASRSGTRLTLAELRPHLHTLPDHPDWIPYRTSYYHRELGLLPDRSASSTPSGTDPYDVVVDTTLEPGELIYGELLVPGDTDEEVIVTSHVCHPSLANDNLTGLTVAVELAAELAARPSRRYAYRFLFAPGHDRRRSPGSAATPRRSPRIRHGLVLTGLGGGGRLVYKQTRHGRPAGRRRGRATSCGRRGGEVRDYSPYGYDERQFNAVGLRPSGRAADPHPARRVPGVPHVRGRPRPSSPTTSSRSRSRRSPEIVDVLEHDATYVNLSPYGEPQLGARGLYPTMGGKAASDAVMAMLWTLAYSDGSTSLVEVADLADLDFALIRAAADDLLGAGLLAPARTPSTRGDERPGSAAGPS